MHRLLLPLLLHQRWTILLVQLALSSSPTFILKWGGMLWLTTLTTVNFYCYSFPHPIIFCFVAQSAIRFCRLRFPPALFSSVCFVFVRLCARSLYRTTMSTTHATILCLLLCAIELYCAVVSLYLFCCLLYCLHCRALRISVFVVDHNNT